MKLIVYTISLALISTVFAINTNAIAVTGAAVYTDNSKTIIKRDFPFYDLVQSFSNVWQQSGPVKKMTLWGAFTYFGTKSTFQLIDQCLLCIANHQDPPNTNCQDSLEGLARNLGATVMAGLGIAYTNGWLGKRDGVSEEYASNRLQITNLLTSIGYNVSNEDDTLHRRDSDPNDISYFISKDKELYSINYLLSSNETGSISIQQHKFVNSSAITRKRDDHWGPDYPQGNFPNCHDQLVIDYCRNTGKVVDYDPASSVTWEAGVHLFTGDWRAAYWKAYLEDDWVMSWRYYKVDSGTRAWWTKCDTGS